MSSDDDIPASIAKRFRNLDFDDVPSARPRPARPKLPERVRPRSAGKGSAGPAQGDEPGALPPVLTTTPRGGQSAAAARSAPVAPASPPRELPRTVPAPVRPPRGQPSQVMRRPLAGAGVIIEEVTISAGGRRSLPAAFGVGQAPGVHAAPRAAPAGWPNGRRGRSPVTLTAEAARQIRLMAHHAGVPGAGLRLLVGRSGRLEDCDFVFEAVAEPDDVVIHELGVHIYLDPHAFNLLRGVLIHYDDLPGLAGFRVGRLPRD